MCRYWSNTDVVLHAQSNDHDQIPARHPLISLTIDHLPPGRNLLTKRTTVPPVQQDTRVFRTALATTPPSPGALIDAWAWYVYIEHGNVKHTWEPPLNAKK